MVPPCCDESESSSSVRVERGRDGRVTARVEGGSGGGVEPEGRGRERRQGGGSREGAGVESR
eukprot:2714976-Rhodomonas_salina.1